MWKTECLNPGREGPKSLKQVVTAPLPNAPQQICVSRVLGEDHFKGLVRVTVGVPCQRTLKSYCSMVMLSIGQNFEAVYR